MSPRYRKEFDHGYDTGSRTLAVLCCGKELLDQAAYEQHMKAKHPHRLRCMKKDGRWRQHLRDGWSKSLALRKVKTECSW